MKVLIINGSPRANGNTDIALREMEKVFAEEGVETKRLNIGTQMIHGCVACNACHRTGKCGFDDVVNRAADILRDCDGLVVGTPVYYASANGTVVSFLDRLFYSAPYDLTFDELNKYFTISGMPVVSSQYWNSVHGCQPGEAAQDAEGLQTMRTLARNMTFLMKSIALGKAKYGLPEKEERIGTNFIR